MESRLRIIRWLRLLLLSVGMSARSRMLSRYGWFWRPDDPDHYFNKTISKKRQPTNQLKRLTMKIRIRLLRWLSLLQFPAYPGSQAFKQSQYALFRRTQMIGCLIQNKFIKY